MTETAPLRTLGIESYGSPATIEQRSQAQEAREGILRELLTTDYEYAQKTGLIDKFYFNPETGEDGLLHTLAGNLRTDSSGAFVAEGFHHEPSAEIVWPSVMTEDGQKRSVTRVSQKHLAEVNSAGRAMYRKFPLEPYQAQVVVNGLRKYAIHKNEEGENSLVPAKNSMFPKEYDALAVMQAIRIAHDTRDPSKDTPSKNVEGRDVFVADGSAPLMDGKSHMQIRMILDAETGRVMSAMPKTKRKPGIMKLTDQQAEQVIYGPLYKEQQ